MLEVLDAAALRRWAVVTRSALASRRAEIDALNVYPVPDGDTGTNLYLTLDQAIDAVRRDHEERGLVDQPDAARDATDIARAMLLTARGNSGVILSQLVRGLSEVLGHGERAGQPAVLAEALARAAQRAREAVLHPQEGTILTVADAAARAAHDAMSEGGDLASLTAQVVRASRDALAATPGQLEVLARAGVVDAGGAGYLLAVEALDRVVREDNPLDGYLVEEFGGGSGLARRSEWSRPVIDRPDGTSLIADLGDPSGHPAAAQEESGADFEVMYRVQPVTDAQVDELRRALDTLGDSVVVSAVDGVCRAHVHTDDIGAALEAGLDLGRPRDVTVTPLERAQPSAPRIGLRLVACAAGPGIARLFEAAGGLTVPSGPARRASAGELLAAVRATGSADVILLPNDRDTRLAADAAAQAAGQEGQQVHVVASGTAVQGIAALAVYEPGTSASRNAVAMTRAAAATRHGGVTIAVKAGLTTCGPCEVGDVLGIVGGDIAMVGEDLQATTAEVLGAVIGGGAELVTLVLGESAPEGLDRHLAKVLREQHRGIEVEVVEGGQAHYPVLIGAE